MKKLCALCVVAGLVCSFVGCTKKDDKKSPSVKVKTSDMEVENGKPARTTINIEKKDFNDEITFKLETSNDNGLKLPADARIAKDKDKVEIEITAGDKTGDFEVKVTPTARDVKVDAATFKVKVK